MHYAAAAGHAKVVDALLDLGANLDVKNDWEQTALEVAMLAGHGALMERLRDTLSHRERAGPATKVVGG